MKLLTRRRTATDSRSTDRLTAFEKSTCVLIWPAARRSSLHPILLDTNVFRSIVGQRMVYWRKRASTPKPCLWCKAAVDEKAGQDGTSIDEIWVDLFHFIHLVYVNHFYYSDRFASFVHLFRFLVLFKWRHSKLFNIVSVCVIDSPSWKQAVMLTVVFLLYLLEVVEQIASLLNKVGYEYCGSDL